MSLKMYFIAASSLALTLGSASPGFAEGKGDRAQDAIATAHAKLEAARTSGAAVDHPQEFASAEQALRDAREDVSAGKKEDAIMAANHSASLTDAVMLEEQKQHDVGAPR